MNVRLLTILEGFRQVGSELAMKKNGGEDYGIGLPYKEFRACISRTKKP
jgi:hypothetical protein